MTIQETKSRIKSNVWKAIAQSKLDLTAVPESTLDQLVDVVSDAALLEIDHEFGVLDQTIGEPTAGTPVVDGERVIWQGRPFLSITTHYRLTNERLRITEGLLSKRRTDLELVKVQEINQTQKMSERMIDVGDITIRSHDKTNPLIVLRNVRDVQRVHELLRRAMLDARDGADFSYREEM